VGSGDGWIESDNNFEVGDRYVHVFSEGSAVA